MKIAASELSTQDSDKRSITASTIVDKRGLDVSLIDSKKFKIKIDTVSDSLTYFGFAPIGSSTASALWRIFRYTSSGTVETFDHADGDDLFDNVWDDRASLTYL